MGGLTRRTVWQIGGGPSARSYADTFLKHDVGLIGRGDAGPWSNERSDQEFSGNTVRLFASEVSEGDVVVLRTSLTRIRAVGVVASAYLYLSQFDDVNGWDLQHARRVRWRELPEEYDFGQAVFGANPPGITRTHNPEVIDFIGRFLNSPPTDWQTAPLPPLPPEELMLEEPPAQLGQLIAEIDDLRPLYESRSRFGDTPLEDELAAHFVVPLLRSLGWAPEQIAVKWRRIDVATFRVLPRIPENCQFAVEAKRVGQGLEGAHQQALDYLKMLGVQRDIVVTDGVRYRMYGAAEDFLPVAYANLARLKQSALNLFDRMRP